MRRILIILLIIILVVTGVWYFYIRPKEANGVSPVPNILKPFFPTSTTTTGSFGDVPGTLPSGNTSIGGTPATKAVFQQMTARAIAGYSIFDATNLISSPQATSITTVTTKTAKGKPVVKKTVVVTPTVPSVIDHYIDYVARENGFVYQIKDGGIPLQVTNIVIPNIYEAYFMDNNTTAIERFLRNDNKTIATYSVPIPPLNPDGTRTQKSGTYLPDNIFDVAISPDQTQIARITTDKNGAILTTSSSVGAKIKTLLRSPFTEWLPSWAGNTVYMQTKAASTADGFFYSVTASARLSRIIGNISGLTTSISPSGTYVLYSQSTDTGFTTSLLNTRTNVTTPIDLAILPEKCVWLQNEDLLCAGNNTVPNAIYPDAWYAGTIHFSDQLYHITTANNLYTVLYNGQGQSFDMTNLQVNENQQLLYFIDKNTGYLWQFSY